MSQQSLWNALPIELQEVIIENSFELCREEYLNVNRKIIIGTRKNGNVVC